MPIITYTTKTIQSCFLLLDKHCGSIYKAGGFYVNQNSTLNRQVKKPDMVLYYDLHRKLGENPTQGRYCDNKLRLNKEPLVFSREGVIFYISVICI